MDFLFLANNLWTAVLHASPEAVVNALFVLVAVLGLRIAKVLPSSKWARATNVVMSVLLSKVMTGNVTPEEVALMTMTAGFAAGLWDLVAMVWEKKLGKGKPFAELAG